MKKTYVVLKDGIVLSAGPNRAEVLERAETESGIRSGTPLGDVEVWECHPEEDARLIWRCTWESAGPLEPNVVYTSPSMAPVAV